MIIDTDHSNTCPLGFSERRSGCRFPATGNLPTTLIKKKPIQPGTGPRSNETVTRVEIQPFDMTTSAISENSLPSTHTNRYGPSSRLLMNLGGRYDKEDTASGEANIMHQYDARLLTDDKQGRSPKTHHHQPARVDTVLPRGY